MNTKFEPHAANLKSECSHPGTLYTLCHDVEAKRLYGAGSDASIYVVDLTAEKPQAEKKWTHHDNYVSSLVRTGGALISGGYDRRLIWTDVESGEKLRVVEAHDGWVRHVELLPDGKRLVTVGDDMLVKLWNAETGELIRSMAGHARLTPEGFSTTIYCVAASPDGKTLASGDRIGDVVLWETETGKEIGRLASPVFYTFDAEKRSRAIGGIRALCYSPDGERLAIGGIGRVTNVDGFVGPCRVEVWDWRGAKQMFTGEDSHKAVLNHVAFHPTEPLLIGAGGGDGGGILAFWDQKQEKPVHKAKPKGHIQQFALDAAAPQLLMAGQGGFQIWNFDGKPAEKS